MEIEIQKNGYHFLKGWMLEQGITIVKEKKSVYGTVSYGEAVTILYFRNVLKFLGPEDLRDEIEKDVWELKKSGY